MSTAETDSVIVLGLQLRITIHSERSKNSFQPGYLGMVNGNESCEMCAGVWWNLVEVTPHGQEPGLPHRRQRQRRAGVVCGGAGVGHARAQAGAREEEEGALERFHRDTVEQVLSSTVGARLHLFCTHSGASCAHIQWSKVCTHSVAHTV